MSEKGIIQKLDDKIRQMGRKTFIYKDHPVRIIDFDFNGSLCRLETTRQLMERPYKEMLSILDTEFTEAEFELEEEDEGENGDNKPAKKGKDLDIVSLPKLKSLQVCETLSDALIRAMDEVEHNASFKDQAQVMANLMGKGIDYARMEIEACKLARDIIQNR